MNKDRNDPPFAEPPFAPGRRPGSSSGARRPYEPPRVVESTQFETLALTCNKKPGVALCDLLGNTAS